MLIITDDTRPSGSGVEGLQVAVGPRVVLVIQLDVQLGHAYRAENHLRVAHHILGIRVRGHLQLQAADVIIAAQGPEFRLLNSLNALELKNLQRKAHKK